MAEAAPATETPKVWEPPSGDQEFEFKDVASAPAWVDKSWASYDMGPALALPAGDLYGEGPYTTKTARVGDKVMFVAATPSKPAHFEVIAKEPVGEDATAKPAQQSNCSLEDALKTGYLAPDDLGPDAKAQVAARSPRLKVMVEEGKGAPEAVSIGDYVKTG
jgi:hypothetical protein